MNDDRYLTDVSFRLKLNYRMILLDFEFRQYPHHRFMDDSTNTEDVVLRLSKYLGAPNTPLPSLRDAGLIDGTARHQAALALVLLGK